jgi:hypothetical protein
MRNASLSAIVVLLLAGAAVGGTSVAFTLHVKSGSDTDAYVNAWKSGTFMAFTPGEENSTSCLCGLTWDVVATVSGTDADGQPALGLANCVFNLTLKDGEGNPVAARYFSRINDGTPGGPFYPDPPNPPFQYNDPLEMAAFAMGWDVDLDYDGWLDGYGPPTGPGRLYDPVSAGGPFMDRVQFPSTSYHGGGRMTHGAATYFADCNANALNDPDEIAADPGLDANHDGIIDACENGTVNVAVPQEMLMGMGIGYTQFTAAEPYNPIRGGNAAGVGIATLIAAPWDSSSWVGLGAKPIAEGQIDIDMLPPGSYTLELTIPEDVEGNPIGQNVIPGSYNVSYPTGTPGGFALPADEVVRDPVTRVAARATFSVWYDCCGWPVTPVAWSSVATHGNGVGELPIVLNSTDGMATSESRMCGLQKLVIVFDGTLTPGFTYTGNNIGITGPGLSVMSQLLATTNVSNDTLIVILAGRIDRTCYTFNLTGVCDLKIGADPTCSVLMLIGDANNDHKVTATDMSLVKSKVVIPPGAFNPRWDINCDGRYSATDMSLVKTRVIADPNPVPCP